MKRIRLTSIPNVKRDPRNDYWDDGTSFKAYTYKDRVPFTYTTFGNDIFISLRMDMTPLTYNEYKDFNERDEFNGASRDSYDPKEFEEILEKAYNFIDETLQNRKNTSPLI